MKFLVLSSILISYLFSMASHPMMMISLIILMSLIMCLILTASLQTSWFSFILFLVFMGGLMVLFIYISSLASNESFYSNLWWSMKNMITKIVLFSILTIFMMNTQIIKTPQLNIKDLIFKVYSPSMAWMVLMTMLYLLLALIIIVNIMNLKEGSLRPSL